MRAIAVVVMWAAGCGGSKDAPPSPTAVPPPSGSAAVVAAPAPAPPALVRYGGCAPAAGGWVTGARALPSEAAPTVTISAPPPLGAGSGSASAAEAAWSAAVPISTRASGLAYDLDDTVATPVVAPSVLGELGEPASPLGAQGLGMRGNANDPGPQPGTGLGTIGIGRYGRIGGGGHSGGIGYHADLSDGPSLSIGTAQIQGDLDHAVVRRYLKRNQSKLLYCYQRRLLASPGIGGVLRVELTIDSNGQVPEVNALGVDPEVASCIAGVVKAIEFPKPKTPLARVDVPVTLRVGTGATSRGGGAYRGLAGGDVDARAPITGDADPARSPLRTVDADLVACARAAKPAAGAVVVTLPTSSGDVPSFAGAPDDDTRTCFTAAVADLVVETPTACAFAYGTLTPAPIRLGAAEADVAAARTAATASVRARHDAIEDVSPVAIAPDPATPMARVVATLAAIAADGPDPILASTDAPALPLAPVPRGTGGTWSPLKTRGHGARPVSAPPAVSILVAHDGHVRIAARPDDPTIALDAPPGAGRDAALARAFAQLHGRGLDVVELAGTDDATYGDVAPVIALVRAAAIGRWQVTARAGLAATALR